MMLTFMECKVISDNDDDEEEEEDSDDEADVDL